MTCDSVSIIFPAYTPFTFIILPAFTMISTSTVLNGAARLTVTGFLAVSFFKQTAVDHAAKVIQEAERVTIVTIGLAAADLCLSTAILFLASDRTARKLLSGDFNAPDSPPLPGNIIADIYTHPPSRAQRRKRFSIESDTTLVADDDNNDFIDDLDNVSDTKQWFGDKRKDGNLLQGTEIVTIENSDYPSRQSQLVLGPLILGTTPASPDIPLPNSSTTITALYLSITTPPQSITLPPKPPDTKLTFNRRQQQHRTRLRAARVRTYIGHLEQLHAEILADKEALLDGWVNAMAKLGLTSTLAPPH
ncbi:hypothetical protein EV702DRAFT_409647 [Suillus placidus]|uniref:Uncharacterized protein n=1 Tax=Suillus placidus TaxID=48579 RepID=A0A9P6ZSK4_9AGAM|nr:hypothetical protein EV702DRAFT_409647 [Suillus placidus]